MTNGDARVAIADEVVVFKDAVFYAPAQEETNATIVFRETVADDGVLAATARVQAQVGIARAGAVFDCDVLALLEADAIAVIVFDRAVLYRCVMPSVEEYAGAAATVEVRIVFAVAIYSQIFDPGIFDVVAADDREGGCSARIARDEVVASHGHIDAKGVVLLPEDGADGGVKSTALIICDADAIAHFESIGIFKGDLFFAKIPVEEKWGLNAISFQQCGIFALASDRDVAAKVERVAHDVRAGLDFNRASAERGDVINCCLQSAVVIADDVGVFLSDGDV